MSEVLNDDEEVARRIWLWSHVAEPGLEEVDWNLTDAPVELLGKLNRSGAPSGSRYRVRNGVEYWLFYTEDVRHWVLSLRLSDGTQLDGGVLPIETPPTQLAVMILAQTALTFAKIINDDHDRWHSVLDAARELAPEAKPGVANSRVRGSRRELRVEHRGHPGGTRAVKAGRYPCRSAVGDAQVCAVGAAGESRRGSVSRAGCVAEQRVQSRQDFRHCRNDNGRRVVAFT